MKSEVTNQGCQKRDNFFAIDNFLKMLIEKNKKFETYYLTPQGIQNYKETKPEVIV